MTTTIDLKDQLAITTDNGHLNICRKKAIYRVSGIERTSPNSATCIRFDLSKKDLMAFHEMITDALAKEFWENTNV